MITSSELDHRRFLVSDTICIITEFIRDRDLSPGSKIPGVPYWARELNVSPCIVQESMDLLAGLDIIELNDDDPACVAHFDSKEKIAVMHGGLMQLVSFQQIYDIRKVIEIRAVMLAAMRRTDEEARQIRYHARRMLENINEPVAIIEHDIAFHLTIAKASQNPIFAIIVSALQSSSIQSWPIDWQGRDETESRRSMIDIHMCIADAIAIGDSLKASICMADHFKEISISQIKAKLIGKANENFKNGISNNNNS